MTPDGRKVAFVTGANGQDGSYLLEFLLDKGYVVHGLIRRASQFNTQRIRHLYKEPWEEDCRLFLPHGDVNDAHRMRELIGKILPDEVYHLAAQSHVMVSFEGPIYSVNTCAMGTLNMLEACRDSGLPIRFYNAASSEMFGSSPPPQNENTPFKPRSPYGCAKVYGFHQTVNFREAYGMFACNGILFNHECLTHETPVIVRRNGVVDILPIGEVVPHRAGINSGRRYTTNATKKLEVWDGGSWTRVKVMTATWNDPDKNDKRVFAVNCRGAYYEASADHLSPLKGVGFVETQTMQPGDHLDIKPLPLHQEICTVSIDEARFLGMMAADGHISDDRSATFTKNNKQLRFLVRRLWKRITGGKVNFDIGQSGFNHDNVVKRVQLTGDRQYLKWLRKQLYTESGMKRIPLRILNGSLKVKRAFLSAYNMCDGLKGGRQKTEFRSFTTNSATLACGLWFLMDQLGFRLTSHPERTKRGLYFHINVNSPITSSKGKHLRRPLSEIKSVEPVKYRGWLFDLETESGTFSAGIGRSWVHNSERRMETFVTRKITRAATRIKVGLQQELRLGNLDSRRDWGFAGDYVEAMWLMLQQEKSDDYVIATGEARPVRQFVDEVFIKLALHPDMYLIHDPRLIRPAEVDYLCGDSAKAEMILGWRPKTSFSQLVDLMVNHDMKLAQKELRDHE